MAFIGVECPRCGIEGRLIRSGYKPSRGQRLHLYKCLSCGKTSSERLLPFITEDTPTDIPVALWRQIEAATPQERMVMLGTETYFDVEAKEEVLIHTIDYDRVRNSFIHSKEWYEFRQAFLKEHPQCEKCGNASDLQVHHRDEDSIARTVIWEGFLEPLKHPERFKTLCMDCHCEEHEDLIPMEKLGILF